MPERDWAKDWELCQRLSRTPWQLDDRTIWYKGYAIWHPLLVGSRCTDADLRFIIEAREALPYWLQRVRELEEENERCKATCAGRERYSGKLGMSRTARRITWDL